MRICLHMRQRYVLASKRNNIYSALYSISKVFLTEGKRCGGKPQQRIRHGWVMRNNSLAGLSFSWYVLWLKRSLEKMQVVDTAIMSATEVKRYWQRYALLIQGQWSFRAKSWRQCAPAYHLVFTFPSHAGLSKKARGGRSLKWVEAGMDFMRKTCGEHSCAFDSGT